MTPNVYAYQLGPACSGQLYMFNVSYYGGGSNPTFVLYNSYSTVTLQPFQYNLTGGPQPILMIMDSNLQSFTIEMTSSDPCATVPKVTANIYINKLPTIYINSPNQSPQTVCATDGFKLITTPNKSSQYAKYMFPGLAYSNFSWYK